ncbi:MAG: hypothetical protein U9O98_10010 [Asgard group archaeon]|nr:hypothetical protein [Asgard group archaeon]
MVVVGAFILPHGSIILDPNKENISEKAQELHNKMLKTAETIKSLEPSLIFLTTPHSIALSNDFGIYLNKSGEGSAEWQGEYSDYQVKINFQQEYSEFLLDLLKKRKHAASGIIAFNQGANAPLRWAESVPLWFIRELNKKTKYILFSQPLRRHEKAPDMIDECKNIGQDIFKFLSKLQEKVIIIISADLAHTHQNEGPYGYSPLAEEFDQHMESWAKTLDEKILVEDSVRMLDRALCCGYIGFLLLQGMINSDQFKSNVVYRETPSYYGMMIAEYIPNI